MAEVMLCLSVLIVMHHHHIIIIIISLNESCIMRSPLSFFFHFLPKGILRRAVDLDFFVQLYSIWLVLIPGFTWYMANLRRMGGFIQVRSKRYCRMV